MDGPSVQALRIAAAVEPLVVHEDNVGCIRKEGDVFDQIEADRRVALQEFAFFDGKRPHLRTIASGTASFPKSCR